MTANEALLWTDGRYFLQAEKQLDSNWTLMKSGQYSNYYLILFGEAASGEQCSSDAKVGGSNPALSKFRYISVYRIYNSKAKRCIFSQAH